MKKKLLLGALLTAAIGLTAVGAANLGVKTADAASVTANPVVWYDFSDETNYGADAVGAYDLITYNHSEITRGDKGIKLNNNTLYAPVISGNSDVTDLLDDFTLSLFFKPETAGTSRIVCWGNYGMLDGFVLMYIKEADGRCYIVPDILTTEGLNGQEGTGGHFSYWTQITDVNAWHNFTVTVSQTEKICSYFFDGTKIGSFTTSGEFCTDNPEQTFSLFGITHTGGGGNTDFYNGYIDDVRIYDFAMTDAQAISIQQGELTEADEMRETVVRVETVAAKTLNGGLSDSQILQTLPKKLNVTGSYGTTKDTDIVWYAVDRNGDCGKAYGFLKNHGLTNAGGLKAEVNITFSDQAEYPLILGAAYTDNMVLQRNGCRITGKAGNTTVTVTVEGYEPVTVDCQNGEWIAELDLETSATPRTVTITTGKGEMQTLNNVLIGEVWFASGQSNMDYNVQQMTGYTLERLKTADYGFIRLMKRSMYSAFEPVDVYMDSWIDPVNGYDDVKRQSAFATSFGLQLAAALKAQEGKTVPVGIVSAAIGGSGIEQWLSKETITEVGSRIDTAAGKYDTQYYYGMTYSLRNMSVSGAIWYQGEDNVYYPTMYKTQFKGYIHDIRALFANGELPVIVAQLPQYNMKEWAEFRYIQWEMAQENTNVYTTVGIEYGEVNDIHPTKDKWQFSGRSTGIAMKYVYGDGNAAGLSPYPVEIYKENGNILISLSDAETLTPLYKGRIDGFEVQINGEWIAADVEIFNGQILISGYENATAVRYFYLANTSDYTNGFNYIYNEKGLPLAPFDVNISARKWNVTVTSASGKVNVGSNFKVENGQSISLQVTPDEGYEIDYVLQNGSKIYVEGNLITTSAIMKDTTIEIVYRAKKAVEYVNVTVDNDKTKGEIRYNSDKIEKGGSIGFIITAKEGYEIEKVTVNGNKVKITDGAFMCSGVNTDLNVKVTYKATAEAKEDSGCSGSLAFGTLAGMIALVGATLVIKRKNSRNNG